ncbi:sensor histidine kinase [Hydrogenophaga sp. A37]|uniref:sensor histidine kinase n=1 Tax=Hydrogenophaga sp. A37 TaxID=1945864 RepID=UPI0009868ACE|nr:PAS domain S-box protein [Hydrogenophaga sp. A37]OOG84694.1 hypothetical protein B0E41_10230 [Hydrogenophaga sp. A37]
MSTTLSLPHRSIPLRTYLTRLLWLCIFPLLMLSIWLAYDSVQTLRVGQRQAAEQMTENFASSVDQYLRSRIRGLNMVAISPLLDEPAQWPILYQQAQGYQKSFDGHVVLATADEPMQMLFNTRAPYGNALPPLPRPKGHAAAPAAVLTRQPAVGDSFIGPVAQTLLVAMAVPVLREGRVSHVVLGTFEARQFQERIEQITLPEGWAMTLRDGRGDTIARLAPPGFDAARDVAQTGRFVTPLQSAPWRVELEISRAVQLAPLTSNGGLLLMGLLMATFTGVLGGTVASRRLGRAVASLVDTTHPATRTSASTEISEINDVRGRLDEAAAQQRESEARFRRLFEDAPVAMRLVSRDGRILTWNARFGELFGYTADEIPTMEAWRRLAYPDPVYRAEIEASWKNTVERTDGGKGDINMGEFRPTSKDGTVRTVQIHGILLDDGLLSTFVDVTERREAEDRLRLWVESFEQAQLGQVISDARDNTVIAVNPAFAAERGYQREEMTGMPLSQLFSDNGQAQLREMVQTMTHHSHAAFECEHVRKDGSRFPVLIDLTVLRDADGHPVTRIGYATNMIDRKRAEAEVLLLNATLERRVQERTAELSAANRDLDSFAFTVSHDLRAPLRAMNGYAQVLQQDLAEQLDESARACLNGITSASHRMSGLIDGILVLSRSARDDMTLGPVDLSALAQRRLAELAASEPQRQVTVSVQPGLRVTADPRMMDVVITNLVDNAWKYSSGKPDAEIRVFSHTDADGTWYGVADNGAGFDPARAGHLFQPFHRLHRQDEFPGIGIGLATVQRIVARHGGLIVARSTRGQGATFAFTLEIEPPHATDQA